MAETTSTAEIRVVADASGVEAGLRQATAAAERTERTLTTGATNATRSQTNLINAIQRTTAQMESGGRVGSKYYETMARQRGIDASALEPYLRQLRAVEQAQQSAGVSAGQARAAMQQLPAQMTDVLVSLQGGQNPMTVLLQQGGQIKDSFGGVGNALRSVGSYVIRLINPVTLLVAAVAGLGYAYYAGSQEAKEYNRSLAATGNAAGTSAALMADAAAQTAKFTGSQSEAAKVIAAMAATGQIAGSNMVELTTAALNVQKELGREVGVTVEEFAALGKDPVKALADLTAKYHHVTGATYAQVKALQDEGRTVEAVTLAQQAHADGLNSQAGRMVENLGHIERAWRGVSSGVGDAASAVKDWFLSWGREDTLTDMMDSAARIQENIDLANARNDTWGAAKQQALLDVLNKQIEAEREKLGLEKQRGEQEARNALADQLRIEITNGMDALLSREELRTRALAAARTKAQEAGLSEAETQQYLAVVRKQYADVDEAAQRKRDAAAKAHAEALRKEAALLAELAGLTPDFAEDWERLSKAYAKGALSLDQLTKLQAELLAKQPGIKRFADEQNRAQEESNKLVDQGIKTAEQYRDSLLEQLTAQRQGNEVIGLSAQAVADLQALRLEDAAALKEEAAAALDMLEPESQVAKLYREQAEALRDLADVKREGARKQIAAESAKKATEDWKRAADDINRSLTDALLRGFESGKSFGKNLVDTLKNMFNTLVLRPVIQAAVNPLALGITGALGVSGTANAATSLSTAGSLASAASGVSNLYGLMTGGATLAGGVGTGFLGSLVGGLNGAGVGAGLTSSLGLSIGNGIASVVGESVASGIAAGIGGLAAAAPWIAGALAVVSLGKAAFGHGPKEYTGQSINGDLGAGGFTGALDAEWVKKGGWFRSDKRGVDKTAVDADLALQLGSAYDAIKAASADFATVLGINADHIASRTQSVNIALGKDDAANQQAITDFFAGVGDSIALELLPSLTSFQAAGESASGTLQRLATDYATIEEALTAIGMQFGAVGVSSLGARERLLEASGGLEAFAANTASFAQNFLTEAERLAPVQKYVTEQMAALGLSAVDSREAFKDVVQGLDLTTDAGAKQYGAMMKLQAAFAQVYPAIEDTAAALAQVNASYQTQIDQLLRARMSEEELRAVETAGMDASTIALYDRLAALKAEAAAAEEAERVRAEADERARAVAAERLSLQDELDELTMSASQLLKKQRDALDESNRAIFDQIQAVKAQKEANEQAAQAIKKAQEASAAFAKSFGEAVLAAMTRAEDAAKAIREFSKSLTLGSLSALDPDARYREAKRAFEESDGSDTSIVQAFLQASRDRDADSIYYERDFAAAQLKLSTAATKLEKYAAGLPAFYWGITAPATTTTTVDVAKPAVQYASASTATAQQNEVARVEAKVDALIDTLGGTMNAVASNTARTADLLDRVTEGGNGMVTA